VFSFHDQCGLPAPVSNRLVLGVFGQTTSAASPGCHQSAVRGQGTFDEHCHSEPVTDSGNTVWLSSFNPRVVRPSNMPFYPMVETNLNCCSLRHQTGVIQGTLTLLIRVQKWETARPAP
jgi:hypothetical protein